MRFEVWSDKGLVHVINADSYLAGKSEYYKLCNDPKYGYFQKCSFTVSDSTMNEVGNWFVVYRGRPLGALGDYSEYSYGAVGKTMRGAIHEIIERFPDREFGGIVDIHPFDTPTN